MMKVNSDDAAPILASIKSSNNIYKHMKVIPTSEQFSAYHNYKDDLYRLSVTGRKLENIRFTVKDVFNTYLFKTEMGSKQWDTHYAGNNARVVTQLLWDGAQFFGKTVTSEFAVHEETGVINPFDYKRTVGTSSAGSAVSIKMDEIDFSLATQTGGSIGRPASYVGCCAIKPSYGLISRTGVLKTCDPFDSVGYFVKDFSVAKKVSETLFLTGQNYPQNQVWRNIDNQLDRVKIGLFIHNDIQYSNLNEIRLRNMIGSVFRKGAVKDITCPNFYQRIHGEHEAIYTYSLAYYFSKELANLEQVSDSFRAAVDYGRSISSGKYIDCLDNVEKVRASFDEFFRDSNFDYFIAPATYGAAPYLGEKEAADLNLFFTYLGLPVVYIPFTQDECELPSNFMLVGKRFSDYNLLDIAEQISRRLDYVE